MKTVRVTRKVFERGEFFQNNGIEAGEEDGSDVSGRRKTSGEADSPRPSKRFAVGVPGCWADPPPELLPGRRQEDRSG